MKNTAVLLGALLCTCSIVQAQLSASVQQRLRSLANWEISRTLVNGSDDIGANEAQQLQQSLQTIMQAGQILSYLNQDSDKSV